MTFASTIAPQTESATSTHASACALTGTLGRIAAYLSVALAAMSPMVAATMAHAFVLQTLPVPAARTRSAPTTALVTASVTRTATCATATPDGVGSTAAHARALVSCAIAPTTGCVRTGRVGVTRGTKGGTAAASRAWRRAVPSPAPHAVWPCAPKSTRTRAGLPQRSASQTAIASALETAWQVPTICTGRWSPGKHSD